MKYTIGQQLFYKNYANSYNSCIVLKILENSMRYRVKGIHYGNIMEEFLMDEIRLFPSIKEGIDSEIIYLMGQISNLQAKIVVLQATRSEIIKGELSD